MEKYTLKKGQMAGFCILIALCVLMNYFGGLYASAHKLPVWLDSTGTVLAAYLGGPVCGALVGMTGNLIGYIAYGDNWVYAIVSIAIGVVVGLAARRKSFSSLLNILTTAAMLTVTATVVALPLHIFFGNYSTGNIWGDAVSGFLMEKGLPNYLSLPVGQIYVELLDKLLTLILLYILIRLNHTFAALKNRRRNREEKNSTEEPICSEKSYPSSLWQ